MKLWARQLALGLLLTAAIPPAAVRAADSAEQILLDKANYWRLKDRPDLARDSLDKLLQLSPGQPDALYAYTVLELQQGNVADARNYLSRLQQSAPKDGRVATLRTAVAAGRVDTADLGAADKAPSIDYQAYAALQQGNLGGAEAQFAAALKLHADDGDALAGLGMVRLRQGRFADSRDLIGRAIKAVPARQREWAAAYDSASFWASVQDAKAAVAAGNYQRAKSILTPLLAQTRPDDWGAELLLGEVEAKLGNRQGAEQAFRRALAGKPQNSEALIGLAAVLTEEGKTSEAAAVASRLGVADRAKIGGASASPAEALCSAAKDAAVKGDAATARVKFQQAIAADPTTPWARLDYARFLAGQGAAAQGFATMDPAASGNTPLAVYAAAIFDDEQHRPADALTKLDRIPAAARTPDMVKLRGDILVAGTTERAKMLAAVGKGGEARDLLATLDTQRLVTSGKGSSMPGSGNTVAPPGAAGDLSEAAGSSEPPPLENTARSAGSADLGSPAKAPATARIQLASLPSDAVSTGDLGSDAAPVVSASTQRQQVAQLELNVPGPVPIAAYQQPAAPADNADAVQPQDSLQLDIERSMAQIESENSPMVEGAFVYRGRIGTAGISQLNEIAAPVDGTFSPWMTGKMTVSVSPLWLDAGQLGSSSLAQFGANQYLSIVGSSMVTPAEQSAFGVLGSLGYAYGPFSAKIGESAWGFPVTNWIGDVAYQPRFLGDQLSVKLEGLREPVTDSLLSYAGTRASLASVNALTGNAFGGNRTWGGVTKTGARAGVYFDDTNVGAFAQAGGAYLAGTNVAQNSEIESIVGAYFRPWKTDTDAVRVGVNLNYFHFDKNLGFYSFGQGGYFSPANYVALTFPVEYQGRWDRWSYLAAVALGVQHFNSDSSPYFPNNPGAQAALVAAEGSSSDSNVVYSGAHSTGLATDLRAQVEYALDKDLAIGASAQYDNGNSYNEGIVKLYIRKTFSDPPPVAPILPGDPLPKSSQ
ncbi:MAG TPA: cellulose synthase subunit BcsC-related outer membrane protein [Stellaceae bacterium]|jgi:Flp pilus assembly protein TadD|nr:cellulose synthase subunit BcsC-related outer membrane protein [Stellaceae bacterium]